MTISKIAELALMPMVTDVFSPDDITDVTGAIHNISDHIVDPLVEHKSKGKITETDLEQVTEILRKVVDWVRVKFSDELKRNFEFRMDLNHIEDTIVNQWLEV